MAVGPQFVTRAQSAEYEPPPWSATWNSVVPEELRNVPSLMLEVPAHSESSVESWNVTL